MITSLARRRLVTLSKGLLSATVALGLTSASCIGQRAAGTSCDTSRQCETGLACLYPMGSGCDAQGSCTIPVKDCSGSALGLVLCGCGGATLDLTCLPSSASLAQRTTTGAACLGDGGSDAAGGPD